MTEHRITEGFRSSCASGKLRGTLIGGSTAEGRKEMLAAFIFELVKILWIFHMQLSGGASNHAFLFLHQPTACLFYWSELYIR